MSLEEYVRIDFREIVGSLQQAGENIIQSVNAPGVKQRIYSDLYNAGIFEAPRDTGALAESPNNRVAVAMGKGRYSQGEITDDGITWAAYQLLKSGEKYCYGGYTEFAPQWNLRDNRELVKEVTLKYIAEELNK